MKFSKEDIFLMTAGAIIIIIVAFSLSLDVFFRVASPGFENIDFSKHRQLVFDDDFRGTYPGSDIVFVMFMDFKCSACSGIWHELRNLMDQYPDVNFVFKHLININDQERLFYASAFECGKLYDVGYELADLLFTEQASIDDIRQFISGKGISINEFNECVNDETIHRIVEGDMYHASFLEVRGSPTIFINGIKIEGAHTFELYDEFIKREIRELR